MAGWRHGGLTALVFDGVDHGRRLGSLRPGGLASPHGPICCRQCRRFGDPTGRELRVLPCRRQAQRSAVHA
ncbi:MAG: hypothetical protein MZW92_22680 [Comamonadaceae bacterium]|nr:hypothetical protein [Comamonadaceae bacterium]